MGRESRETDREATKAIMASILKGKSELVACARDHYGRGASDACVHIHFAISAAGVPADVGVIQSVTADERMQRCLMQVISSLNFPPECAGRQIDFPFTF